MKERLKDKEWREFKLTDIFPSIQRGKRLKKDDHVPGNLPYVSSTSLNNGIDGFIGNIDNVRTFQNSLTLANSGSVGATFYQQFKVIASDHITKLENPKFNKNTYLFLANVIKRLNEKYSFNREINDTRIKKEKILLPINKKEEPDYVLMDGYINELEKTKQSKYLDYIQKRIDDLKCAAMPVKLRDKNWREFFIEEIGKITSGADIYEAERINGETPYITATANNNGIGYFVGNENSTLDKNFLSVNRNGSVGYSFYHSYTSLISNDCRRIKLNINNRHIGLFISSQITRQRAKYGYGYKMGTGRLKRQKIMLPINSDGTPDYEFMENYMKYLEYQKLKKYVDFKKNQII